MMACSVPTSPKSWAVTDIAFVRENLQRLPVRQIADELNESLPRVQRLVKRMKKNASSIPHGHAQTAKAVQIGHLGGTSPSNAPGSTSASADGSKRLYGPDCAPPDLLHFLRESPLGAATRALGMAHGTVHRLRHGYWPSDPRKIMQAWSRYKGRRSIVASSWFIRRVRPGGTVRHAGQDYTAPRLAARTGQMLAVARSSDGGLIAQTLELPAERIPLVPLAEMQSAARTNQPAQAQS